MERSIEELVKRVAEGDDQAFTDLYSMTSSRAFYLAKRLLGDDDQAEDVLQEAYVKALTNLDQLNDPSRFQGWLDTIVANMSKNYLRKQQPQLFSQMGPDDDSEGIQDIEDESEEFSPEANVDYSETKRLVQEMIDHLPEDQRMAVLLHYMEDCSVKEIAGIMDCSEGTVKSRLNYGRKQIKQEVEALEKKGIKLYCAPLIPFLFWMFRQDVYAATTVGVAAAGTVGATVATGAATVGATVATGAGTVGSTVATGSGTVGATVAAGTAAAGAGAVGATVASGAGTVGATVTTGAGTVGATVTAGTAAASGATVAGGAGTVGATVTAGTAAASGATMAGGAGTVGATVTAGTTAASGAAMAAGAGTIGATVTAGTAAAASGAAAERSANTAASYTQGVSQGTPYNRNTPYNQNVPYNQGAQYNQNMPYDQGAPYNQNVPYNQGAQYNQNVPNNQGTAGNMAGSVAAGTAGNVAGSVAAGTAGSVAGSAAAGAAGNIAGTLAAGAAGAAVGLAGKAAGGAVKAAGGAAKAAGRGAASIVRDVIIILIVLSVLGFGVYKGYEAFHPEPGPEATVEKLEKALNEMDIDGIIECFDPAVQSILKASISMFSIFSSTMGFDVDISSALPGLLEFGSMANGTLWPTFELETLDVTYTNDDKTMASVTVSIGGYDITGKVYDPETEVWTMKKIDRTWYIEVD